MEDNTRAHINELRSLVNYFGPGGPRPNQKIALTLEEIAKHIEELRRKYVIKSEYAFTLETRISEQRDIIQALERRADVKAILEATAESQTEPAPKITVAKADKSDLITLSEIVDTLAESFKNVGKGPCWSEPPEIIAKKARALYYKLTNQQMPNA